jgi:hypothetical protein
LLVTPGPAVPVTLHCLLFFILGSSLLRAKNQDGKSALDVATSPEIRALLESVGREDKFIEGEARWQHTTCSSLVSELLLVMLRSYMETYLTLHIENELKGCKRRGAADAVRMESRGKPKFKFDYIRFLKDYESLRKLRDIVRGESKNIPVDEMIEMFRFLLQ